MTSILIVDHDTVARTALKQAFERFDGVRCATIQPSAAPDAASLTDGRHGIILAIDSDGSADRWEQARRARADDPAIAIGYLSGNDDHAWSAAGVPHSVVFDATADPATIATVFLRLCRLAQQGVGFAVDRGARADLPDLSTARARLASLGNDLIHLSRLNAMGMMATTLADELSQPLTTISNHLAVARMLVDRAGDPVLIAQSLQAATEGSRSAGEIIRTLQSLATPRETHQDSVVLDDMLRDAADIVTLGRPGARITLDLPASLIVSCDRILIQQTLLNLLQNAVDAADGTPVDIVISASDKGQVVEICVADSGPGIDRTLLPDVFEPFVTTKSDGLGIGLPICKAIVEAQGGVITLRNQAERGAIACFTVPRIA
ncbi:sensor histidine kinase [Sphingomonas sp. PAMC 26605]|uniref:sensor histidine kinase n=1 Tax=Sphingomonas sp. PAMC 26605 TaxID=1112214 RepID=UPI00026CB567|nr:ATP-binding protein [Sphingomonas sp. PAMC 26605]